MGSGDRGGRGNVRGGGRRIADRRTRLVAGALMRALQHRSTPWSAPRAADVMRDRRAGRSSPDVDLREAGCQQPRESGAQNRRHVRLRPAGFAGRRSSETEGKGDGGSHRQPQARRERRASATSRREDGGRTRRSVDLIVCSDLQGVVDRGGALAPEVGRGRWRIGHLWSRQSRSERHELLAGAEPVARETHDVPGRLTPVISLGFPPFPQARCRPFPAVFRWRRFCRPGRAVL